MVTFEVSWNEYLALLWSLDGTRNFHVEKQTIKKIAKFERNFQKEWRAWRKENFKCAGAATPGRRKTENAE